MKKYRLDDIRNNDTFLKALKKLKKDGGSKNYHSDGSEVIFWIYGIYFGIVFYAIAPYYFFATSVIIFIIYLLSSQRSIILLSPSRRRKYQKLVDLKIQELAHDVKEYFSTTSVELLKKIETTTSESQKHELISLFVYNRQRLIEYRNYNLFDHGLDYLLKLKIDDFQKRIQSFYGLTSNIAIVEDKLSIKGKNRSKLTDQVQTRFNSYLQFLGTGKKIKAKEQSIELYSAHVKQFKVAKLNWEEINKKRGDIGKAGELLVIKFETDRLINENQFDSLKDLIHISETEGDGAGYDILSADDRGFPIYIEVKSTTGGVNQKLFFSKNEIDFMNIHPTKYMLYRVYNLDIENMVGDIMIYRGKDEILKNINLIPTSYEGNFKI
ncbi:DUF3883 domain-containing protein [Marivirga sp.]|uniref:DUF3883 domain-containing protein n=1 Tax=Marivirga sp. TaxID=2018662 RepID=UPI003DA791D3